MVLSKCKQKIFTFEKWSYSIINHRNVFPTNYSVNQPIASALVWERNPICLSAPVPSHSPQRKKVRGAETENCPQIQLFVLTGDPFWFPAHCPVHAGIVSCPTLLRLRPKSLFMCYILPSTILHRACTGHVPLIILQSISVYEISIYCSPKKSELFGVSKIQQKRLADTTTSRLIENELQHFKMVVTNHFGLFDETFHILKCIVWGFKKQFFFLTGIFLCVNLCHLHEWKYTNDFKWMKEISVFKYISYIL